MKKYKINMTFDCFTLQQPLVASIIRKCVETTLEAEQVSLPCEFNVLVTNDAGIHAINKGAVQIGELTIGESTASVGSINRNGGIRVVGGNIVFDGLAHKMTIVDLSGKIVASANACNTYNISALASGSYIVSAYVDGRHTVCKIIK